MSLVTVILFCSSLLPLLSIVLTRVEKPAQERSSIRSLSNIKSDYQLDDPGVVREVMFGSKVS
jgi:hypothetical protein